MNFYPPTVVCKVENCPEPRQKQGYCGPHYYRWRKYGDPLKGGKAKTRQGAPCNASDCTDPSVTIGYCSKHYQRLRTYGDPEAPFRRALDGEGWRGLNNNGYIVLKCRGKTVMEHRQVMEQILGRPLLHAENVHHVNGLKTDNRPENLELWATMQPTGQRAGDLIEYARDVLRRYSPEDLVADAQLKPIPSYMRR